MASSYKEVSAILAENIKKYRMQMGWSQVNLGIKLGRGSDYIAQIERGFRTPTLKSLCEIAAIFGIEPYELLKAEE